MRTKLSIFLKLSLLITFAVSITAYAINEVYVWGGSAILTTDSIGDLVQETDLLRHPLETRIDLLQQDVLLLSQMAITRELMELLEKHGNAPSHEKSDLKEHLADMFVEMLRTTPHYMHISLMQITEGNEVLRVERFGERVEEMNEDQFVIRAEEALFQDVLHRNKGEISFSDIDLHRENGKIISPHFLTLQAAGAVYAKEKMIGVLMIEVDFSQLLKDIPWQNAEGEQLYVVNTLGDFLAHPDSAQLFGSDLGHPARIQNLYAELPSAWNSGGKEKGVLMPKDSEHGNVLAYHKYRYDPLNPQRHLGILIETPYRHIIEGISDVEKRGLALSAAIAAVAAIIGMLFLRIMIRPLGRIADMVVRYRKGEKDISLPPDSQDEIGVLAREFGAMMKQKNEEDWVKENLVGTTNTLLGFKHMKPFAEALIEGAAQAVGAPLAMLYVSDRFIHGQEEPGDEAVSLLGAYGYKEWEHFPKRFASGEGLIGQCLKSWQSMLITHIPENYLRIASALGESAPCEILLMPILFENRVAGVMELARWDRFSPIQQNFMEQLCFNAGVILNGISSGMRTEELLEETRQTAEELQRSEEELKTQQEELQSSNEELEEKTKALEMQNSQVRKQSQELERASTYKSEFLANMSHELRTPLNSLLILAKSLAGNEEGNLTDEQVEEANVIHRGGLELLSLINDILDLSKVEAGKISLHLEAVPLDGILHRMQQQFLPLAGESGVLFEIRRVGDLPGILHTDAQRVEQILKNLLSNAFKFTSRGAVVLEVAQGANEMLAFSVIDTGIGIDPEKLNDIFEAFQQEDGSIDRHYGGTGLGLTIARKFARLLGGEIRVKSAKGKGSVFSLLVPMRGASGAADALPSLPEERLYIQEAPKKNLLIIEDDRDFAKILTKIARKKGYACILAENGAAGIKLAQEQEVTAIILDLGLPDMDGFSVLNMLKDNPKTKRIPVHVISGQAQDGEDSLHQGAVGHLHKPVTSQQFDMVLARIEARAPSKVKRLLLVEDDENTQKAIHTLLKKSDIEMQVCASGKEALEQVQREGFDCIILDLQLPDMNGFEWLEQVEGKLGEKRPPVIVHTARELTEEENRRLQQYTGNIVIKGAGADGRLLDEVTLFLHSVEAALPAHQQISVKMQHDPEQSLQGRTVLVVDDDLRNTFALSKVLKKRGLTVVIADNGQMALDKLHAEKNIDLVIMDIMMPVMDGYQAIREIRAKAKWRELPILALTARAMPEEQEKCIAAGANDYLTKPVDLEKLMTLISVWLFRQEKAA